MKYRILILWAVCSFLGCVWQAEAACSFLPGGGVIHKTIALANTTVTVGNRTGFAGEGVFYVTKINLSPDEVEIQCFVLGSSGIKNEPLQMYLGMPATQGWGAHGVYNTNINGVGAQVFTDTISDGNVGENEAIPMSMYAQVGDDWSDGYTVGDTHSIWDSAISSAPTKISPNRYTMAKTNISFFLSLKKTSNITPTGDVNLSTFPHLRIYAVSETSGHDSLEVMDIALSGTIHIQSPSCTTPNVAYNLGEHNRSEFFSGTQQVSPWVPTPVRLTSCSTFAGNSGTTWKVNQVASTGTSLTYNNLDNNMLAINLKSDTTVFDASKGIITLTSGQDSASGVGIQLGTKSISGNYAPLDLNVPLSVPLAVGDSSGTVEFPLYARYIATTGPVSGGQANASMTYTIDYQ